MISAVISAFGTILIRLDLNPNTGLIVPVKEFSMREGLMGFAGSVMIVISWAMNMYARRNRIAKQALLNTSFYDAKAVSLRRMFLPNWRAISK